MVQEFIARTAIKREKLDALIERILIQYGDDSVQELECATVLFNIKPGDKIIEDRRLEVILSSPADMWFIRRKTATGKWLYLREETIMASPLARRYEENMDRCLKCMRTSLKINGALQRNKTDGGDGICGKAAR